MKSLVGLVPLKCRLKAAEPPPSRNSSAMPSSALLAPTELVPLLLQVPVPLPVQQGNGTDAAVHWALESGTPLMRVCPVSVPITAALKIELAELRVSMFEILISSKQVTGRLVERRCSNSLNKMNCTVILATD